MSLPKVIDNYSTTIVGSFTSAATTITVATPPTVITSGYLTIFDLNGDQLEKIKFTGVSGNDLTGCIRGLSFTVASDTPPGGLAQALQNGMEVKLSDSVSYYNPIIDILNGDTATPNIMKNPATRTITDHRHLVDKEYADGISAAGIISMLVSDNGGVTVNINSGTYLLNGTVKSYAGASAEALTDDATNYIQITDGSLAINTTGFTDDSIPLATVITASGDITSLVDNRPFYTGVDVKASTGLGRDATGIFIDLATDPGLQFTGGKLDVKVKSGGYIIKDGDGLSVDDTDLATQTYVGTEISSAMEIFPTNSTTVTNNSTNRTTSSATYVKLKETQYNDIAGIIYVSFEMSVNQSSGACYAKIYKNGVAYSSEFTVANPPTTLYDFQTFAVSVDVSPGDLVQVYAKTSGIQCGVQNFKFGYIKQFKLVANTPNGSY